MTANADQEFERLYRDAWSAQWDAFNDPLLRDRSGRSVLLRCATPVLAFGRWKTALIATAGLNPSDREFCEQPANGQEPPGREIAGSSRRFLHRGLTDGRDISSIQVEEARDLAERYFERGNAYWRWFAGFTPFLERLGWTFANGRACNTDYVSPFATARKLGDVALPGSLRRKRLQSDGARYWKQMLATMSNLQVIVGMGTGWGDSTLLRDVFGFAVGEWQPVETRFDEKNAGRSSQPPYFLRKMVHLDNRPVHLFWWKPYFGDPLTLLNSDEKRDLADIVKSYLKE